MAPAALVPGDPQSRRERSPWLSQAVGATAPSPSTRKRNSRGFCLDSPWCRLLLNLPEVLPEAFRVEIHRTSYLVDAQCWGSFKDAKILFEEPSSTKKHEKNWFCAWWGQRWAGGTRPKRGEMASGEMGISKRSRNGLCGGEFGGETSKNLRAALDEKRKVRRDVSASTPTRFLSKAALPARRVEPGAFGLFFLPSTNILPLPMFLSSALDADPAFHVVQTQYFFGCQGLCVTCRLGSVCSLDHKGTENAAQNVYGIFRPRQICSMLRALQSEHPGEAG